MQITLDKSKLFRWYNTSTQSANKGVKTKRKWSKYLLIIIIYLKKKTIFFLKEHRKLQNNFKFKPTVSRFSELGWFSWEFSNSSDKVHFFIFNFLMNARVPICKTLKNDVSFSLFFVFHSPKAVFFYFTLCICVCGGFKRHGSKVRYEDERD